MSWSNNTHVSDQAQGHFGDILGNIVHIHQYPRIEWQNDGQTLLLFGLCREERPNLKRHRPQQNWHQTDIGRTHTLHLHDSYGYENINALLGATYEAALLEKSGLHEKLAATCAQTRNLTAHLQHLTSVLDPMANSQRKRKECISSFCCDSSETYPEEKL